MNISLTHTTSKRAGQIVQDWRCPTKRPGQNILCTGRVTTLGDPDTFPVGGMMPVVESRTHSNFCSTDAATAWAEHYRILIRLACMRGCDIDQAIDDKLAELRDNDRDDVAAILETGRASLTNSLSQQVQKIHSGPGAKGLTSLELAGLNHVNDGTGDDLLRQIAGQGEAGPSEPAADPPARAPYRRRPVGQVTEFEMADLSQKTPMGNPVLTAPSNIYPDVVYSFSLHKKKGNFTYFRCKGCPASNKHYRPVVVRVSNLSGRLATDVDHPNRAHICVASAPDGRMVHALSDEGRAMRRNGSWTYVTIDPGDLKLVFGLVRDA